MDLGTSGVHKYRYIKKSGALQEAMDAPAASAPPPPLANRMSGAAIVGTQAAMPMADSVPSLESQAEVSASRRGLQSRPPAPPTSGLDPIRSHSGGGMFFYTVEDGQHVLMVKRDGTMTEVVGPKKIFRWGKRFRMMQHHVAHPSEFLILKFRDGNQKHIPGPAHVWIDPRKHMGVEKEDSLEIAAKEAVVVYSKDDDGSVSRRIVYGPASFVPEPGEWLHTFSWHGSAPGHDGFRKVPNALVFQKLWLMPDQMYHDVADVRTADDAVLTIRLMMFFELVDVETMLASTHDPVGDFVNAATSDVVELVARFDFESFKRSTDKLNQIESYKQLAARAEQCGYRIHKVVYRGYGAPASLQEMHDQAIESRTRLQLEKETQKQAQELEDMKQEREIARNEKERVERTAEVEQKIALERKRQSAQLLSDRDQREFAREQAKLDAEQTRTHRALEEAARLESMAKLSQLGVDLTQYLTQARADQVIELRGGDAAPHVHIDKA